METERLQIRVQKQDRDKFKLVLLYVLSKVSEQPDVGETVLYKLLYFIDFDYYELFEENLMGETYIKTLNGPASIALNRELEDPQKEFSLTRIPDFNLLSEQEKNHIDEVLVRLSNKNAKDLEIYCHGDIPWKSGQFGKPISYESVFYRDDRYSVRNYGDEI